MNQCEETEEGVHPSETPLCGQHDNQTKAQRKPDFSEYLFSHPLKRVATADGDSVLSSDSWKKQKMSPPTTQELGVGSSAGMETMSTYLPTAVYTGPAPRLGGPYCPLPPPPRSWLDFSEYLFSHPLKDVTTSDGDSDQSPTCRISQGSPTSSESSYVSNQSKRSTDRDFDFKKKKPDFSEYLFSHPLKRVATADRYSVLSSYSGLGSLESLSSYLKKDSFRSSDSRPFYKSSFRSVSLSPWLGSGGSPSSYSERDVTTSDGDSDQSPTCRISQGSPASSESSCVSNQSKRSTDRDFDFKKNQLDSLLKSIEEAADDGDSVLSSYSGEEEKDELPITQELVVGSNAGMETKSTPVHLQLSSLHKLQLILSLQQETNDE